MDILRAQKIDGWMMNRELEWLAERASLFESIIEVGCFLGRSTRAMADNTSGMIYAVDPWDANIYRAVNNSLMSTYAETAFSEFQTNLSDHIRSRRVEVHRKRFEDFHAPSVDMIFIDGDHRLDAVLRDVTKALRVLRLGGLICGHDYGPEWPDVRRVVDILLPSVQSGVGSLWWATV